MVLVKDTTAEKTSISNVPIACEFLDIFPDKLPSLLPHRETEFYIDIVPDIAFISMPPYRMALVELKELKE